MVKKGYKQTEQQKRKIGLANAIKMTFTKGHKSYLTEESKKKMSLSRMGHKVSDENIGNKNLGVIR